jgi:hypothetical protein
MTKSKMYRRVAMATGATLIASTAVLSAVAGSAAAAPKAGSALVGTFKITAGGTKTTVPTGSYFRMLVPGGKLNGADSNYFANPSSTAKDHTYTLLAAGSDGGLKTGAFEPAPTPAFDGGTNALAHDIIKPVAFDHINFSVETETPDPVTHKAATKPSITATSGHLSGNVEAFSASWHGLYFDQGSKAVTGTYNSSTGAYKLTWTSTISGGPFNGFTGQWVLTGKFVK